jgi:hypothetical protein
MAGREADPAVGRTFQSTAGGEKWDQVSQTSVGPMRNEFENAVMQAIIK